MLGAKYLNEKYTKINSVQSKIFGILLIFFCFINNVFALQITEIQFDPLGTDTDREWIEVYNETANSIDLTSMKFFEANVNHGIDIFNTINSTDKNILGGEYVVVVQDIDKFKVDFPSYTGKIFKSSFSLSNTGETLALKEKDGNVLFTISYTESDKQAVPSPGQANTAGQNPPNPPLDKEGATSATSTGTTTNTAIDTIFTPVYTTRNFWPNVDKFYVKAGENMIVMAGQIFVSSPKVVDENKKEIKNTLQYRWNFGDGQTSEDKDAKHFYKFPGEYIVYLEVNNLGNIESDKMYVKVVDPELKLNFKNLKNEEGIEIFNLNSTEINIGEMILRNDIGQMFTLPKNTLILPSKNIFLTFEMLKFASTSRASLEFSNGKIVADTKKEIVIDKVISMSTSSLSLGEGRGEGYKGKKVAVLPSKKPPIATKTNNVVFSSNDFENTREASPSRKTDNSNVNSLGFLSKLKKVWGF